jgi:heat shock protein HtpX
MFNTIKVGVLLTALTGLLIIIGKLLGGQQGMIMAFGFAVIMNLGTYWFSDKLVLAMTKAQQVNESDAPELYSMVRRLAQKAELPMPRVYIVPDDSPNAFATGRSPQNGVVAVNRGLMRLLDAAELEGVVAHELAHIKHRDTLTSAVVATVAGAIMMLADMTRWALIFGGSKDREEDSNPIVLIIMTILAPLAAMLIQMAVSRAREYEADASAARFIGTGRGLSNALMKLERGVEVLPGNMSPSTAHLCIVNPLSGGSLLKLFSTHPPIEERVKRLGMVEAQLQS